MAFQRNEHRGRVIAACLLAAVGLLVVLTAWQKQHWDTDILWALKSGEWIFANHRVPSADPFSYTFGGRPWVDFTWGFQVLAHLFYSYLGQWTGLFILQSVVVGLTFVFLYLSLRLAANRAWLASAVLVLAFAGAHSRFFIRPHLFEYFFVSLSILLFTLHEKKGRPLYLLLLLPAQLLWVNTHSSAILGIFIACAWFGGQVIDDLRRGGLKMDLSSSAARYLLVAVALPVVSLLNPYGLRLVIFPFRHNSPDNADAIRHIGEWVRPHLNELFFYFYPFPVDRFAFALAALLLAAAFLLNIRRVRAREPMLLAAALYMALSHVRWLPLFFFFAAPVLVSWTASWLDSRRDDPPAPRLAASLIAVLFAAFLLWDYLGPARAADRGLGLKRGSYPSGTVEFMKREGITGSIYNEYVYGGYLIFHYPEVKVFIDGRTPTVYSPHFFWKSRLVNDPARWKRLTEEYGIDMALIKLKDKQCEKLHEDKDWKAVSFDDTSILYLRDTERFKGVIARRGLGMNACSDGFKELPDDEGRLNEMRAELSRMLEDETAARSSRAYRLLGFAYAKLGRHEDAAAALEKSLSITPDSSAYYTLGTVLGKLNKKEEALDAFKSAVKINRKHRDGWLGAGVVYYDMKDYANAIESLKTYVRLADDESEQLGYKTLGEAYFEAGEPVPAAVYLERAAFLTDDESELADIYYKLGNALFESGDYAEGARHYALAVEKKPDYADVLKELARTHRAAGRVEMAEGILALFGGSAGGVVKK